MTSAAGSQNGAAFAETAWSLVLAAGHASEPRAHDALAELCRIYWPPVYGFLRRRGYERSDAQDLTQTFFQQLIQDETVRRASPERGRFRSFLLGALGRCLADEQARRTALKRGGQMHFIPLEELAVEEERLARVDAQLTPAESLDLRWAGLVLQRALERVRAEFSADEKSALFDALAPFLEGEKPDASYGEIAQRMQLTLPAVKTHIHRIRRQFAGAVRREIMDTVAAPHEVEEELRHLRAVLSRRSERAAA